LKIPPTACRWWDFDTAPVLRREHFVYRSCSDKKRLMNQDAYDELCSYTLAHGDPSFIHQHVVDAFIAQNADHNTKRIGLAFALIGLYLHVEEQFSGKEVQRAHMFLARRKRDWPTFPLPADRGSITEAEVLAAPAEAARDKAIDDWCKCVWTAYRESHQLVRQLAHELLKRRRR
jgi:Family of unknown function (DUF5946)